MTYIFRELGNLSLAPDHVFPKRRVEYTSIFQSLSLKHQKVKIIQLYIYIYIYLNIPNKSLCEISIGWRENSWVPTFPKMISTTLNENSVVQDLNLRRLVCNVTPRRPPHVNFFNSSNHLLLGRWSTSGFVVGNAHFLPLQEYDRGGRRK